MKASLCACLFAGLCATASASGFNASILSQVTFNQPWRDLDSWFAYIDTSGSGAYTVNTFDSQGYGGNLWAQRTMISGTAGDGVNAGTVSGSVEIYTIFWFDFGIEGGSLSFTHQRLVTYAYTWGDATGIAFDSVLFDGVATDQTNFTSLQFWHSVQLTTRVEGFASETYAAAQAVPDSGSPVALFSLVLFGLAHQFQIVARRNRARTGEEAAA